MGHGISVSKQINVITSHITTLTSPTKPNNIDPSLIASVINVDRSVDEDFRLNKMKPIEIIRNIKTDVRKFESNKTSLSKDPKICFICCNSYEGTRYALGDSAINDGILSYIKFKQLGYQVYIFHDMMKREFANVFRLVLGLKVSKVVVYYIGHGTTSYDCNGDEDDRQDECLFFSDGTIVDDDLYKYIVSYKACDQLVLISDCCHSGTIYDVPDRDDVLTLSAARDSQTAKQDWIERKGQGIFTYYFWKYYADDVTLGNLKDMMNKQLTKYIQEFVTNRSNLGLKGFL